VAKSRIVDLNEWQQWRQEYPRQYWLLKQYIIGTANPREWFTTGQMLGFLTMHRDLFASEHIRFTETGTVPADTTQSTFAGKPAVVIGISLQGVKTCENYWSAVKQVLSVLSSKKSLT
jgi:hypothetical protein